MELRYLLSVLPSPPEIRPVILLFYVLPQRINKSCPIIEQGLVSLFQIEARFSKKTHTLPVLDIRTFGGELLSIFLHEHPNTAIVMEYSVRILKSAMGTGTVPGQKFPLFSRFTLKYA
jgi:hypothetical protein